MVNTNTSVSQECLSFLTKRPRRNRKSAAVRSLVQETRLHPHQLVAPLFIVEGQGIQRPIPSLPHVHHFSCDRLIHEIGDLYALGIRAVDLFAVIPEHLKDAEGSEAIRPGNLLQRAVNAIKEARPEICVMVDIALDPFTDHGHDGIVDSFGEVDNDLTLSKLAKMSILMAEAGADILAPSDMMDGRIAFIRQALDKEGYIDVSLLSYSAKYASSFYGPFRDAIKSGPKFGNKKSYQMNPANCREALLEVSLDENEGADMLLIKPALLYLDVIAKAREVTSLPLGAFHVSGEYAMVMAAAEKGWLNADEALWESLLAIKRAGADFILTYAAKRIAHLINEGFGE